MKRAFAVGVGLLLVLALAASPASVVTAQDDPTPTANETAVRHVNPDRASGDGDLKRLASYLNGRLADRLSGSAIQISQGQYEQANGLLGDEYRSTLNRYVDVAGETGNEEAVERFRKAREQQRDLANRTHAYRETVRKYQEAKRNGNTQRARRLARELEAQADTVVGTGRSVRRSYRRLGNTTGVNLSAAETAVNLSIANVTAQQRQIRADTFVATTMTVRAEERRISFTEPLVATGRLEMANGTAVRDRHITLRIHNRTVTTQTNADGTFSLRYRPVTLPANATNVTIRYVPNTTSILFGSNASVPVQVTQVDSTVTIQDATGTTAFDEPVAVTARVTAAGTAVSGLPVALSVDGRRLAMGRTTADGTVTVDGRLPANVRAGNRTLRVSSPTRKRAVAGATATEPLTVAATATNLTAMARMSNTTVTVRGRLTTAAGRGVAGQPVEVRRNGTTVTSVTTGPNGTYQAQFEGERGRRYWVRSVYDDPSTNLAPATARVTVAVPQPDGSTNDGLLSRVLRALGWTPGTATEIFGLNSSLREFLATHMRLVGGGVLAVLVGGVALWWTQRRRLVEATGADRPTVTSIDGETTGDEAEAGLASARRVLDADPPAAVERAYRTVRTQLQSRDIATSAATHWEFYDACQSADVDDVAVLEALTESFEQAAFGRDDISRDEAETALVWAGQFVSDGAGVLTD